ncbi:hypothetical protein NZ47_11395 [Anaerovibrio lipolyticus]|uniref:Radical SAM core domain-containing protein n=1 Tax=Anaerovibrio lipolyticus TaxID=82374 RepID=A0A0B2JXC7_9FIRM|nr:radical SAM protein [Anaerovibrio lipolyticus]KHM51281.1 hypothetical protein NZ47_11395 [Anaerovibrio lipolyticus]
MKWHNPGHEFDNVYKSMVEKEEFYFFGAGDYGKQFLPIMEKEINIKGYIDNNTDKQRTGYEGYTCYSLDQIDFFAGKTGIIITVSQMQRSSIVEQLKRAGYEKDMDFFIIEEFLSVYFVYKYDKVYFSSISFLPSTVCNLKCKACLNFNPFAKQFYVREWEQVKADIDLFFKCVDHIMLFHVSGGEPMLYKHIAKVIDYLDKNYGDRIDTLRTVTNGTVIPDDSTLEVLSNCSVEITVDDYREAVPKYNDKFDFLLKKLDEYSIRYYINYASEWIDLAPDRTDFSMASDEQMIKHFDNCCQSWQELRDGKLFSCNYDAYAAVAGINKEPDDEIFDLRTYSPDLKRNLVEFRLGYNVKGYTNFCRKCMGISEKNPYKVAPAEQI